MAEYNVKDSTDYGGKDAPTWMSYGFHFPGYHNAYLSVTDKQSGEEVLNLQFKISPSSFTDARSMLYQTVKTMAGYVVMRLGRQPIELSISGYMLDIKNVLERHDFLENMEKYIYDKKNYNALYYNDYNTKLVIEGREYYGLIQGLSFTKTADNPFLYTYQLSFTALGEKKVYNPDYAVQDAQMLRNLVMNGLYQSGFTTSPALNNMLSKYMTESSTSGVTTQTITQLLSQMPEWLKSGTEFDSKLNKVSESVIDINAENSVEQQIYNMVGIGLGVPMSVVDQVNKIEGQSNITIPLDDSNTNSLIVDLTKETVSLSSLRISLPSAALNKISSMKQKARWIKWYDGIHHSGTADEDLTIESWQPRHKATEELYKMSEELQSIINKFVAVQKNNDANSKAYKEKIDSMQIYSSSWCHMIQQAILNDDIATFTDTTPSVMAVRWNTNAASYGMDSILGYIDRFLEYSNEGRW